MALPADAGARTAVGFARTGSFEVPPRVVALMRSGMELGDADDKVFNDLNSNEGRLGRQGDAGRRSHRVLRARERKLALAPFVHDESGLYGDPSEPLISPRE